MGPSSITVGSDVNGVLHVIVQRVSEALKLKRAPEQSPYMHRSAL